MREIKFRAWNIEGEKWCDHLTCEDNILDSNLQDYYYSTLSQFTGLRDKNGKEIYEGDILGFNIGDPTERTWAVKWCTTPYTAHFDFGPMPRADFCEVIGNIYENPKLLTGGADVQG